MAPNDSVIVPGQLAGAAASSVLPLLIGALVVSSVMVPVTASSANQADASAEDALEARERALDKLAQLEDLDATTAVDVDWAVKRSIKDQIQRGNVSFRSNRYSEAIKHYEKAVDQAKAALTRAYSARASLLLNASQAHLERLEAAGYNRADIATYQQKRRALDQRLQRIDSFGEARDLHGDAEALHSTVKELPDPNFVRFVDSYYTVVVPLQIILMLLAGVLGAAAVWLIVDHDEDEDESDGSDGGEIHRPATMD